MGVGVGTWVTASVFLADFAVSDPAIPTPSSATAMTRAATIPSGRIMDASWRAMGSEQNGHTMRGLQVGKALSYNTRQSPRRFPMPSDHANGSHGSDQAQPP